MYVYSYIINLYFMYMYMSEVTFLYTYIPWTYEHMNNCSNVVHLHKR